LFGDQLVDGYPGLLNDLAARGRDAIKPEPCLWFGWGEKNGTLIRAAGFEPKMVSGSSYPHPLSIIYGDSQTVRWSTVEPDYLTGFGCQRYGRNIYWLKFAAILEALEKQGYDEAVWLDMDVELIAPLPLDFWPVLQGGQPLQAPLVQYHRIQAPWRKQCPRTSIYCATAYFRGQTVIKRCLEFADQRPLEFEQAAMNRVIDELAGGEFPGHQGYHDHGFEFPFTEKKGGMIHTPLEAVFRIHSKGWSTFKRDKVHGVKRWQEHVEAIIHNEGDT